MIKAVIKTITDWIPTQWRTTLVAVFAVILLSLLVFFDTWQSIVVIWYRSPTFNHGFLVIPISLWLIWVKRREYRFLIPGPPSFWAIALIIFSGFLWLLADLINVQIVKQFAAVAILLAALLTVLGYKTAKKLTFPLAFLFFMVPFGEEFILPLREFTATFTVKMLSLTGIPVYREGLSFSIPSGHWSVIDACSGISYLIASLTLGFVYAYLNYQSLWKRLIFALLSIAVPIIANGFRAYMIVMIGHLSGMSLAVGVDHLIYGGIFFAFVMMLLFYLGSFWRDLPVENDTVSEAASFSAPTIINRRLLLYVLSIAMLFSVWPLSGDWLKKQPVQQTGSSAVNAAALLADWQITNDPLWFWRPRLNGVTEQSIHYFAKQPHILAVYQASFGNESQGGAELVNSQNLIISPSDLRWKQTHSTKTLLTTQKDTVTVEEIILSGEFKDLLVYRWYQIGQKATSNDYLAKLYQLAKRLTADTAPELQVIMLIECPKNRFEAGRTVLKNAAERWLNGVI